MSHISNIVFVDNGAHQTLLPLTFTRPVGALRLGIITLAEKWALQLNAHYSFKTEEYLQPRFSLIVTNDNLLIFGGVLPSRELIQQTTQLEKGQGLFFNEQLIVARVNQPQCKTIFEGAFDFLERIEFQNTVEIISRPHHLVALNKKEICNDFELITKQKTSEPISPTVTVVRAHSNPAINNKIFIEPGALVEHVMINPADGPVYIGKDAVIMEGSIIRGPFAMCDHAQVNMGAKIYGGTTLGPWCKVGGELNNALLLGYSNKGHDGFLGDSVIGEWCNLGADTNTSNLKNDFAEVKLWDYQTCRFLKTGLQFLGLIMGDYSRCGINTMFNSGTVVGVACNLHGTGYPRNFIPSFALGGAQGFKLNSINEACKTVRKAMERRNVIFSEADEEILKNIFEITRTFRTF